MLPSAIVKTLGVRENFISKLYQHFRVRDHPYGLQDSLSTLHLFCSPTSLSTPPQAQDSIRAGGYPLPDGDFHPERYAELPRRENGKVRGRGT